MSSELNDDLLICDSIINKSIASVHDILAKYNSDVTKQIITLLERKRYTGAIQLLRRYSFMDNNSSYGYNEYLQEVYEKDDVRYIMTKKQYENIIIAHQVCPEDYIIAVATKNINYDDASIDLNYVLFHQPSNRLFFDGKFKLYYTLNSTITKAIKVFMLNSDKDSLRLDDLVINKTSSISLQRCNNIILPPG